MELMFTDREGQPQVSNGVVHVQEIGVDTARCPGRPEPDSTATSG
jgi:hypothetical protein